MLYHYVPRGVCSRTIDIDLDEKTGVVRSVRFTAGCSGNTQGVASLVEGMARQEIIDRLSGIDCNFKGTSCPDHLALALKTVK